MKNLIYLALILGTLYFIFSTAKSPAPARASSRTPETTRQTPEQTAAIIRISVRGHLRSTLKDYDSLKDLRFSELQTLPDGSPMLQFSFRAKNSFGAYGLEAMEAVLNTNSNTVLIGEIK